jgi:hypothetical protein
MDRSSAAGAAPTRDASVAVVDAPPLPPTAASAAVARCAARTVALLARGRVHLPRGNLGLRLRFGDGSTGRVYRETVVDDPPLTSRCVLVVSFRLRGVRGRGHRAFEVESVLNTPLFVGFPGFVSKLWVAADEHGVYRGVYDWDDPVLADAYARALWWVLALVSHRSSIHHVVLPGKSREELLAAVPPTDSPAAQPYSDDGAGHGEWWRVTSSC